MKGLMNATGLAGRRLFTSPQLSKVRRKLKSRAVFKRRRKSADTRRLCFQFK